MNINVKDIMEVSCECKRGKVVPKLAVGQAIYIPFTVTEISVTKPDSDVGPLIQYKLDGPVIDNTEFYTEDRLKRYFEYKVEIR